MTARQLVHDLVDQVPESELPHVARYLEFLKQESEIDPELQEFLRQRAEECRLAEARGESYTIEQAKEMSYQWISKSAG